MAKKVPVSVPTVKAPFVGYDVYAYVKTEVLVAEPIEDGFRLVRWSPLGAVDTLDIAFAQIPRRWGVGVADPVACANRLKVIALREGATPEAIRCLRRVVSIVKNEEEYMAEKLKAKGGTKKTADKDGLKEAAKKAPVARGAAAGETGTKKRGNADALKKAREAKGPDTRKIKALKKPKDIEAREGTFRRKMLEDILAAKTVAEWREKNSKYDSGCLKFAVDNGYVSVN